MKLPLRHVDIMNSLGPMVSVASKDEQKFVLGRMTLKIEVPYGFCCIIDAESELVAIVPDQSYKDWKHSETIATLLNWAAENYPARNPDA